MTHLVPVVLILKCFLILYYCVHVGAMMKPQIPGDSCSSSRNQSVHSRGPSSGNPVNYSGKKSLGVHTCIERPFCVAERILQRCSATYTVTRQSSFNAALLIGLHFWVLAGLKCLSSGGWGGVVYMRSSLVCLYTMCLCLTLIAMEDQCLLDMKAVKLFCMWFVNGRLVLFQRCIISLRLLGQAASDWRQPMSTLDDSLCVALENAGQFVLFFSIMFTTQTEKKKKLSFFPSKLIHFYFAASTITRISRVGDQLFLHVLKNVWKGLF